MQISHFQIWPLSLNMNECFLSEFKLHISHNKLTYNIAAFCTAHIVDIIRRAVDLHSAESCRLTVIQNFQLLTRFNVDIFKV